MTLGQPVTTKLAPYQACTACQQYVHLFNLAGSFIASTGLFLEKAPIRRAVGCV
jgi:hypothetical protein